MKVKKLLMTVIMLSVLSALATIYFKGVRTLGLPWDQAEYPEGILMPLDSMVVEGEDTTGLGPLTRLDPEEVDKEIIEDFQSVVEQKKYLEEQLEEYRLKQEELFQMESDLRRREISLRDREMQFRQAQLTATNENLINMAKLYENMKADMAAPLMITMSDTMLVQILRKMKDRNSAKILSIIGNENLADVDRIEQINMLMQDMPAGKTTSGD